MPPGCDPEAAGAAAAPAAAPRPQATAGLAAPPLPPRPIPSRRPAAHAFKKAPPPLPPRPPKVEDIPPPPPELEEDIPPPPPEEDFVPPPPPGTVAAARSPSATRRSRPRLNIPAPVAHRDTMVDPELFSVLERYTKGSARRREGVRPDVLEPAGCEGGRSDQRGDAAAAQRRGHRDRPRLADRRHDGGDRRAGRPRGRRDRRPAGATGNRPARRCGRSPACRSTCGR